MNKCPLLLILLLTGCATSVWTETTETTRPVGQPREVIEDRPLANRYLELRTSEEADGFYCAETVNTDDRGRVNLDLLPAALQCLHYRHDVQIELRAFGDNEVVYQRTMTADAARDVVREWAVQAKLGAEIPMRQASMKLLEFVIEAAPEREFRELLDAIRERAKLRLDWE